MIVGSLNSLGPVRAAELGLSVRNEAARRPSEPKDVTVEIVRPLDPRTKSRADADALRSEATTERLRLDITV